MPRLFGKIENTKGAKQMTQYIINSLIALGILLLSIHGLILWVRVNRISDEAQHYRRILFDMITDLQNENKYQEAKREVENEQ